MVLNQAVFCGLQFSGSRPSGVLRTAVQWFSTKRRAADCSSVVLNEAVCCGLQFSGFQPSGVLRAAVQWFSTKRCAAGCSSVVLNQAVCCGLQFSESVYVSLVSYPCKWTPKCFNCKQVNIYAFFIYLCFFV